MFLKKYPDLLFLNARVDIITYCLFIQLPLIYSFSSSFLVNSYNFSLTINDIMFTFIILYNFSVATSLLKMWLVTNVSSHKICFFRSFIEEKLIENSFFSLYIHGILSIFQPPPVVGM